MLRICIALTLAFAAMWSYAWADDDWGDGHADIIHVSHATDDAPSAPAEHNHAAAPDAEAGAPLTPSGNLGAYFGAGDVFLWSGAESGVPSDEQPGSPAPDYPAPPAPPNMPGITAPPDAAHMPRPHGDLQATDGEAAGSGDPGNVYGPMWGVPEGVLGVEGDPTPTPGDPELNNGQPQQHEDAASDEDNGDKDIRNHKINRDDPNDW